MEKVMDKRPQHILLTGATSGLGLALARYYRAKGERPLLIGRRSWSELPHLAAVFSGDDYCQVDLAQPDCAAQVMAFLQRRAIDRLDVVVHNAGVGFYGRPAAHPPAVIDQLIDVNVRAPVALARALLPWLPVGRGQVVFIGSVAADLPAPDYAVYAATKAALAGFARSLRAEWRGQVTVQLIQPGPMRTEMHAGLDLPEGVLDWQAYPPADHYVPAIARAIAAKRPYTTLGPANRLLSFAGRHLRPVVDAVAARRASSPAASAGTSSGQPPLCVITGAADGIGRALAHRYARAGYTIAGVDVDAMRAVDLAAELAELGVEGAVIIADLRTAVGVQTAVSALQSGPSIDVLIHNAGISAVGPFAALAGARQLQVLDLNLRAPLQLTTAVLAAEKLSAGASVVFVSSLSKFTGYPGAAVYAATKNGLAAYARGLRAAAWPHGHVLTVYPGPTRTAHARRHSPDNGRESRRMLPEQVADGVFTAVQKKQAEYIPGWINRVLAVLGQWLPGLLDVMMGRFVYAPLRGRKLE